MRKEQFVRSMSNVFGEQLTEEQALNAKSKLENELGTDMSFNETLTYFQGLESAGEAAANLKAVSKDRLGDYSSKSHHCHHRNPLASTTVIGGSSRKAKRRGGFTRPVEGEVEEILETED